MMRKINLSMNCFVSEFCFSTGKSCSEFSRQSVFFVNSSLSSSCSCLSSITLVRSTVAVQEQFLHEQYIIGAIKSSTQQIARLYLEFFYLHQIHTKSQEVWPSFHSFWLFFDNPFNPSPQTLTHTRPGKSCKRCKRRLRTFCRKSRYFEDILSQGSRTFVAIY